MDAVLGDHFWEKILTFGEQIQRTFERFSGEDILGTDDEVIWGTVLENTSRTWERHFGMHFRLWFWGTDLGGRLGHSCGILGVVAGSMAEDGSEGHLKEHF